MIDAMIELRRHIDESIWIRDPVLAGAPGASTIPVGEGLARAELLLGGASFQSDMTYRRSGGDPGLGMPTGVVSGCNMVAALAPRAEVGGLRLGAHLRGGVTASDPRCMHGRSVISGEARLEGPVADARFAVIVNATATGAGSPFAGSANSRRANHRAEVGIELGRGLDAASERVAVSAFAAHDRESMAPSQRRGVHTTGINLQYERAVSLPTAPGANVVATLIGEARVARVVDLRPTTQAAAILRLRINY